MPNGDPDWGETEYPKLEKFFGKISGILENFAESYNLIIDKYYHQGRDWTFRFRHPEGGLGQIFIIKQDEEHVGVAGDWHVNDYDALTRYTKHTEIEKCSLKESVLLEALTRHLKLVLSWRKEDLKPVVGKYKEWKKRSKEEFNREFEKYPTPKID